MRIDYGADDGKTALKTVDVDAFVENQNSYAYLSGT